LILSSCLLKGGCFFVVQGLMAQLTKEITKKRHFDEIEKTVRNFVVIFTKKVC